MLIAMRSSSAYGRIAVAWPSSVWSRDESRTAIGQRVDRIELGAEAVHDRIVDRRPQPADVDLSEVKSERHLRFDSIITRASSAPHMMTQD
jgi:hypothetical protein